MSDIYNHPDFNDAYFKPEVMEKADLFTMVIYHGDGVWVIDTTSEEHLWLNDIEYNDPIVAIRAIRDNGLVYLGIIG
jgi:hypothetical protein